MICHDVVIVVVIQIGQIQQHIVMRRYPPQRQRKTGDASKKDAGCVQEHIGEGSMNGSKSQAAFWRGASGSAIVRGPVINCSPARFAFPAVSDLPEAVPEWPWPRLIASNSPITESSS